MKEEKTFHDIPLREDPADIREKLQEQIALKCGQPYRITEKGWLNNVNQLYFVERFAAENKVIFDQEEARFYPYNESNGAWERVQADNVKFLVKEFWQRITREFDYPGYTAKPLTDFSIASSTALRPMLASPECLNAWRLKSQGTG